MRFDGFWSPVEDLEPEDREYAIAEAAAALDAADAVLVSDEAVERAAKALCAAEFPEVSPSSAWNVQFEDGQRHYREQARVVIVAALDQAGQS
jgi:hypothetical protein